MDADVTEHRIVLCLEKDGAGPYLCCCGLVLWDAEQGMHHLTEHEPQPAQ